MGFVFNPFTGNLDWTAAGGSGYGSGSVQINSAPYTVLAADKGKVHYINVLCSALDPILLPTDASVGDLFFFVDINDNMHTFDAQAGGVIRHTGTATTQTFTTPDAILGEYYVFECCANGGVWSIIDATDIALCRHNLLAAVPDPLTLNVGLTNYGYSTLDGQVMVGGSDQSATTIDFIVAKDVNSAVTSGIINPNEGDSASAQFYMCGGPWGSGPNFALVSFGTNHATYPAEAWFQATRSSLLKFDIEAAIPISFRQGDVEKLGIDATGQTVVTDIWSTGSLLCASSTANRDAYRLAGYDVGFMANKTVDGQLFNACWNESTGTSALSRFDVVCGDYGAGGPYGGFTAYSPNWADPTYQGAVTFGVAGACSFLEFLTGPGLIGGVPVKWTTNYTPAMILDGPTQRLGIGDYTAPAGRVHINGQTDEVSLIVEGAAAQASNLQEWRASDGSVLGYTSAAGDIVSHRGLYIVDTGVGLPPANYPFYIYKDIPADMMYVYNQNIDNTGSTMVYSSAGPGSGDETTIGISSYGSSYSDATVAGKSILNSNSGTTVGGMLIDAAGTGGSAAITIGGSFTSPLIRLFGDGSAGLKEMSAAPSADANMGRLYYYNDTSVRRLAFKFPGDEDEVILAERTV